MAENINGRALDWDEDILNEQREYTLLPAGDYHFTVTGFERARYEGGPKLPPCAMAKLTILILGNDKGDTTVTHRLYLHSTTQGLLGSFFESIGQCKRGETFKPRWDEVVGTFGLCRVGIHEYVKKDGQQGQSNEITRFLPPPEPTAAPAQNWAQGAF